jgi:hypothetical protein
VGGVSQCLQCSQIAVRYPGRLPAPDGVGINADLPGEAGVTPPEADCHRLQQVKMPYLFRPVATL